MPRRSALHLCLALGAMAAALPAARAEKGDTFLAFMSAKGLPEGAGFVPPVGKAAKDRVSFSMNDAGVTSKGIQKYTWTADFPTEDFGWERLAFVSSKLPGAPVFMNVSFNDGVPEFFTNGNWSLGELGAALQYNGLDASALFDNSTYAVLVLDEASRTAIGAPLESFPISQYGDGLISNDTAGTESELVSDLVYVCTVENTTVAFDHGYEVGYRPAAGVGVILIQALPDGSMLWTIDTTNIAKPRSLQLRLYQDLGHQPIIAELEPDLETPWPRAEEVAGEQGFFGGNITTSEIETGLAALGTTWAQTNFNTTPSTFIMTLYTADNRTLLGFVYDAFSAPPQLPVIKGESVSAAGRAGGGLVAAAVFAAALLLG